MVTPKATAATLFVGGPLEISFMASLYLGGIY